MYTGTLLQDIPFKNPITAVFFNLSPTKLIVACSDDIFMVDVSTQSTEPFSNKPQNACYRPNALALSEDDAVLVAGCANTSSVCGFDTALRTRLWIYEAASAVGAVCMLGACVLVTVAYRPILVLDRDKGTQIASLFDAEGRIHGLGVIEGFMLHEILNSNP
jgi:hypothetical protein